MLEWIEWIGFLPLLGLTGNWRGYRMGGKAIGGASMSTDMKKKFEQARAAGKVDEAKAIADKAQEVKDKKKAEKAAKTIASGASNNVDIKIAGKEISVPQGVEIVATMSQPPVGSPYRVMPKGGGDNDFIREKARGNSVPVLQFKTAQAAQNYADKINKAMEKIPVPQRSADSLMKSIPKSWQGGVVSVAKSGSDGFAKGQAIIPVSGETTLYRKGSPREGFIKGDYMAAKDGTVTHIPSGLRVINTSDLKNAKLATDEVIKAGVKLPSKSSPNLYTEVQSMNTPQQMIELRNIASKYK